MCQYIIRLNATCVANWHLTLYWNTSQQLGFGESWVPVCTKTRRMHFLLRKALFGPKTTLLLSSQHTCFQQHCLHTAVFSSATYSRLGLSKPSIFHEPGVTIATEKHGMTFSFMCPHRTCWKQARGKHNLPSQIFTRYRKSEYRKMWLEQNVMQFLWEIRIRFFIIGSN